MVKPVFRHCRLWSKGCQVFEKTVWNRLKPVITSHPSINEAVADSNIQQILVHVQGAPLVHYRKPCQHASTNKLPNNLELFDDKILVTPTMITNGETPKEGHCNCKSQDSIEGCSKEASTHTKDLQIKTSRWVDRQRRRILWHRTTA